MTETETEIAPPEQEHPMIPFLIASVGILGVAVVFLVMALSGVFSGGSRSGSRAAAVDSSATSSASLAAPGPPAFFTDMVTYPAGGMFGYGDERALLALGKAVCDALGNNTGREQIEPILTDPSQMNMDSLRADYLITASIRDLCPQYSGK